MRTWVQFPPSPPSTDTREWIGGGGVWEGNDPSRRPPPCSANSHVIRAAGPADALALQQLARAAGATPLAGRILVAEVRGAIAAAIAREDRRTLAHPATAPAHLTTLLRLRADGLDAFEREPDLAVRLREAVLGRDGEAAAQPLAA